MKNEVNIMRANINGRLRKFKLKKGDGLVPIQEAVVNSIQSKSTKITVEIIRAPIIMEDLDGKPTLPHIQSFKIKDNGDGFNNQNYNSFEELDSELKRDIGGKGIGRISFLKAFEEARIKSVYEETGKKYLRKFIFKNSIDGIENEDVVEVENKIPLETTIELLGYKEDYRENSPKKMSTISENLLLHLLEYFINLEEEVEVFVEDNYTEESISLRDIYNKDYKNNIKKETIKIDEEEFEIKHMKLSGKKDNLITYVSNNRKVKSENFNKHDVLLKGSLCQDSYLNIYISGKYFDKNTNDERNDFEFSKYPKDNESIFLTEKNIVQEVVRFIKREYKDEYNELIKKNKNRIDDFLKESPQYKNIFKNNPIISEKISPEMTFEAIDNIFYEFKRETQKNIKKEISKYKFDSNSEEIKKEILKKIDEIEKTNLAEYVLNRKLVLDFLEKSLKINENGEYNKENLIHDIFFPTKMESNDIEYEEHNLWLIDDRLSFNNYAFSDQSLISQNNSNGMKRPDILIYNKPVLIKDKTHTYEEESFYIVEFKRPERNDYNNAKNPTDQVLDYAKDIREERLKIEGRRVKPSESAVIYAFVICDITPSLKENLERYLTYTPDSESFYWYFPKERVFLEVHSYDKVLKNAKKRNRIFFEKLDIG